MIVTPLGSLAVTTNSAFAVLDAGTGQPLWSRRALRGARLLDSSRYALLQDSITELVDLESGATRWAFSAIPGIDLRAFVWMPERQELLVSGAAGDSFVVAAVGIDSGDVRWRRADWFPDSLSRARVVVATQPPLRDSDSTFLLYPSHLGPIRVDARTGAILWRSSAALGTHIPSVNDGHAAMAADGGRIFVPFERRIAVLDQATGAALWERGDFPAEVVQLAVTPRGLLIGGRTLRVQGQRKSFVYLVQPTTAASSWPQPITRQGPSTNFSVSDEKAFVVLNNQLLSIDLLSGTVDESLKVQFQGGEDPQMLERRAGRLVLSSSQNVMSVSDAGRVEFHSYHPAPRPTSLVRKTTSPRDEALGIVGGLLAGFDGYRPPQYTVTPVIIGNPALSARHRASASTANFHFLVTDRDPVGGPRIPGARFSFVRVDKRDGSEIGRLRISDRSPRFVFDPASGTVFLYGSRGGVQALRFSLISDVP